MLESKYQKHLIDKLKAEFPGCFIMKNDPTYKQGVPDILVLYKNKWAMLEVKNSMKAHHQPNQEYYVDILDKMSFASFIYPENEEEVFDGLHKAFRA